MKNAITNKVTGFTYIEVLFALFITIVVFTMLPLLYKSIVPLKHQSNFASSIDLEFFARDLTEELLLNKSQFFNIENRGHRLKITNKEKNIYYEFKNRKIIKTINHSGNITLLNNVIEAQFTMLKNKRMKLYVKLYNEGTYFEKEIYF
ncbi:competence protein [Staphylococcus nepalensis]|uniref:Competence protein n=1 Tax=Staphylococcus nepalensis TaxID=214473 RepID=A0A291JKR8_9STAP|nr:MULTISPECIES: competence type IV pilus minor pilin ComGF [Staphylococcus]VDG67001.1 Competence protein ComGF [Lacrimispora indolis]ATH59996.1 hypothetical protein BJD96_06650 [Staphylococcus nepalensis]ATH65088.1 hypothetical protein BJG89_06980 [Staphylococcus nepalensis]AWI44454.1 hypothetical protein BJG88_06775 [Staphylococcus nepalensis]MBO1213408.1 ComGF family competence protein [Staphylococcus nepalensis]